ncbi:hypothetical protein GCM10009854_13410 [Saccharopolyspora halophila]|uniref:Uncharacterized protein n=1 Tax=Saccharopolyspora halophila TaxID=405551 RepID=A0ABP5STR0_9PSEU
MNSEEAPRSGQAARSADTDERARKRRLAEIFGDVLPEETSDDRPDPGQARGDRWYEENRPPHHG